MSDVPGEASRSSSPCESSWPFLPLIYHIQSLPVFFFLYLKVFFGGGGFYQDDLAASFWQHIFFLFCFLEGGLSPQSAHKEGSSSWPYPEKYNYPGCSQAGRETRGPLTDNVPSSIFLKVPLNYNFDLDNETELDFFISFIHKFSWTLDWECVPHKCSLSRWELHGHRAFHWLLTAPLFIMK